MDGFSDKLSQHFASSHDMINANSQAEATEIEKLQNDVRRLVVSLEDMKDKFGEVGAAAPAEVDISGLTDQLGGISDKLETHIHKENVRVYRNVQAALTDELGKQAEQVNEQISTNNQLIFEELKNKTDMLSAMLETLNEQQKSQGQAVSGMAAQLNEMEESVKKSIRNRALLPIQIVMLVVLLGELAINVMLTLGYL